jgi:hypothetical protein
MYGREVYLSALGKNMVESVWEQDAEENIWT